MTDLIIVGAGLSGLIAAAIAEERGARVRLIAQGIGTLLVTPGWISVADRADSLVLDAVRAIATESPDHPYALAGVDALYGGIDALRRIGTQIGLSYDGDLSANLRLPTALGTTATPALAPRGLAAGHDQGADALFIGFNGWRDFYPALTGRRTLSIDLPGTPRPWDAMPSDLARAFDDPRLRESVAAAIRPHLVGIRAVGFPAVLGLDSPIAAQADLNARLGVPVFEIPTLPPSVPGLRLFNALRRYLLDRGVRIQIGHPVIGGLIDNGRVRGVTVAAAGKPAAFHADAVILATGGLYGGGLFSDDRGRIREPLFDLPVLADSDRLRWFSDTMLNSDGHPVQQFGVQVNAAMQPIRSDGSPVIEGLYAIGHLIAQPGTSPPDACHEGIALATACKAIDQLVPVSSAPSLSTAVIDHGRHE